jgi:hypothetical protein
VGVLRTGRPADGMMGALTQPETAVFALKMASTILELLRVWSPIGLILAAVDALCLVAELWARWSAQPWQSLALAPRGVHLGRPMADFAW